MQAVTIDLTKSPDIAAEVADLEPGDSVTLHASIKSLDAQTLVVTVEELSVDGESEDEEPTESDLAESPGMIVLDEVAGI
jgi:hypothetical protein